MEAIGNNSKWATKFAVILCGLPLHGWVAVVPSRFHFVVTPLTVDRGILSNEEIPRMDFVHKWQPIMVPCLNSVSSWERPILSQMFVEAVLDFIHLWPWKWLEHLNSMIWRVSWYFCQYSVSDWTVNSLHFRKSVNSMGWTDSRVWAKARPRHLKETIALTESENIS